MKSRGLIVFLFVLLVGIIGAYFFQQNKNGAPSSVKVKIGITPFQDTVLPVVPQANGWYKQNNIDVEFVDVGWVDVPAGLASDSFDVAIYTFDSTLPPWHSIKKSNTELVFFAPLYVFKGAAIIAQADRGYKPLASLKSLSVEQRILAIKSTMEQLRGKRIGITIGTTAERVVKAALEKAGMSESDVVLINASYPNNLAAFLSGDLDAFVGGVTERLKAKEAGAVELISQSAVSTPVIDGLVTTRKFMEGNKEALNKLVELHFRSVRFMSENIVSNSPIVLDYLKGKASINYTPEQYKIVWTFQEFPNDKQEARQIFLEENGPYYWKPVWDATNKFLLKENKIPEAVPYSAFEGALGLGPIN